MLGSPVTSCSTTEGNSLGWATLGEEELTPTVYSLFNDISFLWLFLGSSPLKEDCNKVCDLRKSQRKAGLLFLGAVSGKPPASVCWLLSEED